MTYSSRGAALLFFFLAACQDGLEEHPLLPLTPDQSVATSLVALPQPCGTCVFGPVVFEREQGTPTDHSHTIVLSPATYVVDIDDLGTRGADARVSLNAVTLLPQRGEDDVGPRHVQFTMELAGPTSLVVRLFGKPGSVLRVVIWRVVTVTLDAVTLTPGTVLQLEAPSTTFNSIITNHTSAPIANVAIQSWVEQGSARRAGGGQIVYCLTTLGVLPPGTCTRVGDGIFASNAPVLAGTGTLVPGPAIAIIEVRQFSGGATIIHDSVAVPITLAGAPSVQSVSVSPAAVLVPIGSTAQFVATVQTSGGAPTTVTWASSNAAVGTVSAAGLATAVAPGSAAIWATSTADVTKKASALLRAYDPFAVAPFPFTMTTPLTAVTVHRDDANAGPTTVVLTAQAIGPQPIFTPFTSNVEFWARNLGGPWRLLGPATSTTLTADLVNRVFTYSMTWDPDASTAPFGNPSSTVLEIVALGVRTGGLPTITPLNTNVTLGVP